MNFDSFIKNHTIGAFLFDLNGTMINDMPYHTRAWHNIFLSLGIDITYEDTKKECYGKNEEVIERVIPGVFCLEERTRMGLQKEMIYRKEFLPDLKLLPGLFSFIHQYYQSGIRMAIGSAAILPNVDFVLDGCELRSYFDAIVSADHVGKSKPDPETFLKCASMLECTPEQCIVFEDTPKGVECAVNAGMKCVVVLTTHQRDEFSPYSDWIIDYINDYNDIL